MTPVEVLVEGDGVRLATTDWGGQGPDLLLMHGLGMRRRSLEKVARLLAGWRVVTMDLRSHGGSSTAPWSWDAAVSDVAAVVRHLGLTSPYVGGHSLGGMVALRYAVSGALVAGVINIDGWGPGVASRFPGEDPALVQQQLDRFRHRLPTLARVLTAWSRVAREGTNEQVLPLLHGADFVAWHAQAPCPSLALNAVAPARGLPKRLLGKDMARMQAAHRQGLRRDLAAVSQQHPRVHVVEVEAHHGLVLTHPELVARAIDAFAGAVPSTGSVFL